ncbi:MAG: hypothetical protein RL556_707 [Actinomycetota bacterium]|jgi:hypothetical protein
MSIFEKSLPDLPLLLDKLTDWKKVKFRKTSLAILISTVIAQGLVSAPAHAVCATIAVKLASCCCAVDYAVSGASTYFAPSAVPTVSGGPGGTLSVSKSYSFTQGFQVTAGSSLEVDGVLAQAKIDVSAQLSKSNATTSTSTYSHTIASGKFGHIQYRVSASKVSWVKTETFGDCSTRKTSGTIIYPMPQESYYYWETTVL